MISRWPFPQNEAPPLRNTLNVFLFRNVLNQQKNRRDAAQRAELADPVAQSSGTVGVLSPSPKAEYPPLLDIKKTRVCVLSLCCLHCRHVALFTMLPYCIAYNATMLQPAAFGRARALHRVQSDAGSYHIRRYYYITIF